MRRLISMPKVDKALNPKLCGDDPRPYEGCAGCFVLLVLTIVIIAALYGFIRLAVAVGWFH